MPKITYIERGPFAQHIADALATANTIIAEYTELGYQLTLRQLYYQFVARGLIENKERSYKNLGSWINEGRLAGIIDWNAIEDRTRNMQQNNHWDDPQDLLQWAADGYGFDTWKDQPERVEVWVEKEALAGVIERPANEWDVSWFCCRGYVSQSELWRAGNRFRRYEGNGQKTTVIYLGDHDPSGLDIDRACSASMDVFGVPVNFERIALNMDQVEEYNPPPNPTKLTDSRAKEYVPRFGYESWELDALDPVTLNELISEAIMRHCDEGLLKEQRDQREADKVRIQEIADAWGDA